MHVGVGVPISDIVADFNGNNESLSRRVAARLLKLGRIAPDTQVRVLDYKLYRRPPARVRLQADEEVWLRVEFEIVTS